MKALVVTFVRAYNFGAVLQCYALCQKLKALGNKVEVLDYYPEYFRRCYDIEDRKKPRVFPSLPIREWIRNWRTHLVVDARNAGFEKFLSRCIPLTGKQYSTFEEIDAERFECDYFISGSDQVFSYKCVPFDPVFFLQFSQAKQLPRFAYAASFGVSEVPDDLREEYVYRLTGWNRIAVREKTGVQIIKELTGDTPVCTCDPTLLLTKQEWDQITPKKGQTFPYIALYSVNGMDILPAFTKEIQEQRNLEVIALTSCMSVDRVLGYQERYYGFKMRGTASPEDWLSYIANAEYVVTDSFHGVVFSILNRKKFAVLTQMGNYTNNRVVELIQQLDIPGENLENGFFCACEEIDWKKIEVALEKIRKHSTDYLQSLPGLGVEKNG